MLLAVSWNPLVVLLHLVTGLIPVFALLMFAKSHLETESLVAELADIAAIEFFELQGGLRDFVLGGFGVVGAV